MNIDMSQFDDLELDNIGQWPAAAKVVLAVFLFIVALALGYVGFVSDKITQLDNAISKEETLKQEYRSKYHVAANLELFQQQMTEAEELFATQLKSLPNSHETPGLLDDITFVGTTSGLDFTSINWQPEVVKEIYVELPIDIDVVGTYHDFGNFVSRIAGLPRIVTVHDFLIEADKKNKNQLNLKLEAKTYRYQEKGAKK
jgi:type IV pilus assembly protein PilO